MIREYTLKAFCFLHPDFIRECVNMGIDVTDPDYICRYDDTGFVEIGYRSDEWFFPDPAQAN